MEVSDVWTVGARLVDGPGKLRGAAAISQPRGFSGDFGRDFPARRRPDRSVAATATHVAALGHRPGLGTGRRDRCRPGRILCRRGRGDLCAHGHRDLLQRGAGPLRAALPRGTGTLCSRRHRGGDDLPAANPGLGTGVHHRRPHPQCDRECVEGQARIPRRLDRRSVRVRLVRGDLFRAARAGGRTVGTDRGDPPFVGNPAQQMGRVRWPAKLASG